MENAYLAKVVVVVIGNIEMSKKKLIFKVGKYVGCLAIFIAPVLLFVIQFHKNPISNDPADWATFGNYIGGVYSVIVAIFILIIGRMLNKRDDRQKERANIAKKLYTQIVDACNSHNHKSIDELVKDINGSQLLLSDRLVSQLIKLCDSILSDCDNSGTLDLVLKRLVLQQLKDIYNE